jgi:Fur family ferric uptake transcriptional regulator
MLRMVLILERATLPAVARRDNPGKASRAERALAGAGVHPTPQRVAVAAELMDERDDVTAQELHARLRARGVRLGLATVYRTLGLLAEAGAIDALSHRPAELCYRWCGDDHHHHLVCSRCHRVVELAECDLDPWLDRVSAAHGFVATGHRLEVAGLCAGCR